MSTSLARVGVLSLVLALSTSYAEAADVKVTFQSDPIGATLYEEVNGSQKLWGYAPFTLKFQVPRKWTTCMSLTPMTVRWVSGAQASITLSVCPQTGKNQQFTFQRPTGVPGVELDVQFAIAMMQNAAAAATAAAQAAARPVYVPPPAPKHCASTVIGNQVFTDCY